jgi:imidazolonepropionase-like amidohydrolase
MKPIILQLSFLLFTNICLSAEPPIYDICFRDVVLFDGFSFHPRATVYVKGGYIAKVVFRKRKKYYNSSIVIEGAGKTLIPGLINSHVHLIGVEANLREAGTLATLSDSLFNSIIETSKRYNKVSVVHISSLQDAIRAFRAGANGLAHIWYRSQDPVTREQIAEFASRPFFIIPTLYTKHKTIENLKAQSKTTGWAPVETSTKEVFGLYKAGITIVAGTDPPNGGINYGTDLYEELHLFNKSGLTFEEVLRTATSAPATVFQLVDRGTIQVGKRADLVLFEGDLSATRLQVVNIKGIWKFGRFVNGDN